MATTNITLYTGLNWLEFTSFTSNVYMENLHIKWLVQSCSEQLKKKSLRCALAHPKGVVYLLYLDQIKITKYFNEIYCTIYTSASPKLYEISTITDISTLKYANNHFYELHQIGDKSWVTHFHAKTKQYSIPQNPFRYHYHPSFTTSISLASSL